MMRMYWHKFKGLLVSLVTAFLVCMMINMLSSCTRKIYVPIESVKHDSVLIHKVTVDSIAVHDSIFEKLQGDTLYRYKERTEYRYKYIVDTLYVAKVDSIAVPYEVVKEKKVVPKWTWTVMAVLVFMVLIMYKSKDFHV